MGLTRSLLGLFQVTAEQAQLTSLVHLRQDHIVLPSKSVLLRWPITAPYSPPLPSPLACSFPIDAQDGQYHSPPLRSARHSHEPRSPNLSGLSASTSAPDFINALTRTCTQTEYQFKDGKLNNNTLVFIPVFILVTYPSSSLNLVHYQLATSSTEIDHRNLNPHLILMWKQEYPCRLLDPVSASHLLDRRANSLQNRLTTPLGAGSTFGGGRLSSVIALPLMSACGSSGWSSSRRDHNQLLAFAYHFVPGAGCCSSY